MTASIYDLDYKEIAALTDENVRMFIDIEAAEKGFPLLPASPTTPEKPKAVPTGSYYGVAGLFFEKSEDALSVLKVLSGLKIVELDHKWEIGVYIAKPRASYLDSEREMKMQVAFTPEEYERHKHELENYRTAQSDFERREKAYTDAVNVRRSVTTEVWQLVRESQQRVEEEGRIAQHFEEYTKLLDGNRAHAAKMTRAVVPNMGLDLNHRDFLNELLGSQTEDAEAA